MPTPLRLPIRILIKGASTVMSVSPMGGPRTDFTFPRALERSLLRSGRPVEVRTFSLPSERTKTALRQWEAQALGWSPDVVILVYGHFETLHLFLPQRLERHANSLKARPGRLRERYREHLLGPLWMALARLQARADKRLDPEFRRGRLERVGADLARLIENLQMVGSPLVLVFELLPPSRRRSSWFPGMTGRIAIMNQLLRDTVDRVAKDNVRLVKISEIMDRVSGGDLDAATPDGFHYSPQLHEAIGEELARCIATWADTQPHLRLTR